MRGSGRVQAERDPPLQPSNRAAMLQRSFFPIGRCLLSYAATLLFMEVALLWNECYTEQQSIASRPAAPSLTSRDVRNDLAFPGALILRAPHLAHRRGRSILIESLLARRLTCFETNPEARPSNPPPALNLARELHQISANEACSKPWRSLAAGRRNWSWAALSSPSYRYRPPMER